MSQLSPTRDQAPASDMAFYTTHWSVIVAAREQNGPAAQEALAKLCAAYWYPLYAFVRRQGFGPPDAEDLTQEFFRNLLEGKLLRSVGQAGGKFRSFLLTCLKHFLANQRERSQTQRRGGGAQVIPLEVATAETQYLLEPVENVTPEVVFERRWALNVLDQALQRLEQEYAQRNKSDLFEALRGFLPGSQTDDSRSEAAAKCEMSAAAVDVAIHRLRQRYGSVLRQLVALTVSSEAEVDEEIRYLISMLGT